METPRTIGRYEIVREIGRGAMGLVYLAHDPRIDRRVAIKTIHALKVLPDNEAEEIRRRFAREAQAAGKLQHPGIVTIFDVGEHEGTYFIAMEYIEGETLEPHTSKNNLLPTATALHLAAQACEALDYAHQHNIIHRDIKPANLMLVKGNRLKITDFGLAKNPQSNLTHDGVLIGTPNYMSPEQVMGKALDGRTDLFSLAAVLYEMLTGERPFAGESVTTIIYRILHEPPREPRALNAQVPEPVSQVLMKALAKEPAHRFQTGAEFARALQGRAADLSTMDPKASRVITLPEMMPPEFAPAVKGRHAVQPQPAAKPQQSTAREVSWRGRVRSLFIAAATLSAVLLVPATATREDRWGLGDSGGKPPFYRTAGIMAGGAPATVPPPPVIALPGSADAIVISFQTRPPGGRIYLDDVEAPDGTAQLPRDDQNPHTIVAENDCYIEKLPYTIGQDVRAAGKDQQTIALETPKVVKMPVTSTPSGAAILLDGKSTGLTTPAELALSACGAHNVTLRLEGHQDALKQLDHPLPALSVTLARIPEGFIKIISSYPVGIFEKGRKVGESGAPIKLTAGSHTLVIRNEDLLMERTLEVKVMPDKTSSPDAGLPGVGRLTVLASPSNCDIFVNDRKIGVPPINDHELAAGTYKVRAVYIPTGEAKEQSVVIVAGGGTRVPFKFNQ